MCSSISSVALPRRVSPQVGNSFTVWSRIRRREAEHDAPIVWLGKINPGSKELPRRGRRRNADRRETLGALWKTQKPHYSLPTLLNQRSTE